MLLGLLLLTLQLEHQTMFTTSHTLSNSMEIEWYVKESLARIIAWTLTQPHMLPDMLSNFLPHDMLVHDALQKTMMDATQDATHAV